MAKSDIIDLGKFSQGINNVAPDVNIPENSLVSAINVDIDKEGNISRRKGYTKVYSGSNIHSLYKKYFVEDNTLKLLNADNTSTIVREHLNPNTLLAWEDINNEDYYSDGSTIRNANGVILNIPTPEFNPSLSTISGGLSAGKYQVTISYIDRSSGNFGGTRPATIIEVPNNAGILCSNMPVSPDGYSLNIFVSSQNGDELYLNGLVINGVTSYSIYNTNANKKRLDTQFFKPIPSGHILRSFNSRLYSAVDNILWFSEPFRYGLCKTSKDFFQFPARITIVQAVIDGLYVVADKTYFLAGADPTDMKQRVVSDGTGIEGTGLTLSGNVFGDITGASGVDVGYWFSNLGAVIGMPSGSIAEVTKDRLALDENLAKGVTMYSAINGIKQLTTSFSEGGTNASFSFGAQATSTIIRNGVIVP